jgi:hypothetical protein
VRCQPLIGGIQIMPKPAPGTNRVDGSKGTQYRINTAPRFLGQ